MEEHKLPEELSSIINKVRLKQPFEGTPKEYNAGVDKKIDHVLNARHGFQVSLLLGGVVLIAAFAGLYYLYTSHNQMVAAPKAVKQPMALMERVMLREIAKQSSEPAKILSAEAELKALEDLDPGFSDNVFESFEDDELLDDFSAFDEAEFAASGLQTSLVR